jgi:hypothetical protein
MVIAADKTPLLVPFSANVLSDGVSVGKCIS